MISMEHIPSSIKERIQGKRYRSDDIGRSDSQVLLFDDQVLKIEKIAAHARKEYRLLSFLQGKLPVPQLLAREESDGYQYLLMTKLKGQMACAHGYDPKTVTIGLASGLHMLWNVDITDCPYQNTIEHRLAEAKVRLKNGFFDGKRPNTTDFSDFFALYDDLAKNRPDETLVFSHGDYCLPNVFLNGKNVVGFLDLGCGGIADQWYDIMMCLWSMKYNFCEFLGMPERDFSFYQALLFSELGLKKDEEKLRYHRLLDLFFD